MAFEPFLESFGEDHVLPTSQSYANSAIIVIFAFLVPLLTMEINYFRLAIYQSWRKQVKLERRELNKTSAGQKKRRLEEPTMANEEGGSASSSSKEDEGVTVDASGSGEYAVGGETSATLGVDIFRHRGQIIDESSVCGSLSDQGLNNLNRCLSFSAFHEANNAALAKAYRNVRYASMQSIFLSMTVYSATAAGIALNTQGMDPKVIAIIVGASKFMASLIVFIISAKIPQWIGVYHQRAIHLVKCSSNYSKHVEDIDINDEEHLASLRTNVRLGVCFHFAKFYIILMPFYCGVHAATIPLSIVIGVGSGFVLMWCVFVVHEKYIHHRNAVAFFTIFILMIISSLTFTRGMAWIQTVWALYIFENEDVLMVISFFSWLAVLALVHILFIRHTLLMEEKIEMDIALKKEEGQGRNRSETRAVGTREKSGNSTPMRNSKSYSSFFAPGKRPSVEMQTSSHRPPRNSSYNSFIFDPRTHFKDVKEQRFIEPDDTFSTEGALFIEEESNHELMDDAVERYVTVETAATSNGDGNSQTVSIAETPVPLDADAPRGAENTPQDPSPDAIIESDTPEDESTKRPPSWMEIFVCLTPEYKASPLTRKILCWVKIAVLVLAYFLFLYFVIVCIGATKQISSTRKNLPYVQEVLYNHMNEGEVCAFDNRGPESNITTFPNKEAAHEAGFLVAHCGACGACSSWDNLIVEYATRDNMAALANQCAKKSLFGGGDDALLQCLMEDDIGFSEECALCWMEDILCTKDNCAFIFLQAQMINNVGNFAVGENDITSASCEEAHCEVGQFVPCSGATRRRMNIVSSIARPGVQQCSIVDVESWEDLFYGSGIA